MFYKQQINNESLKKRGKVDMIVELQSWSGSGFQDVNVFKLQPSQNWLIKDFGRSHFLPRSPIYDSRSI